MHWTTLKVDDLKELYPFAQEHRYGKYHVIFQSTSFFCTDLLSLFMSVKDIFLHRIYDFQASNSTPYVIDGGAHIGISVIRYKKLYPQAQIVAFEPDPEALKLLRLNLEANQISDVEIVPAGLYESETSLPFESRNNEGSTFLTNNPTSSIPVVKLSSYMTKPIDFLKLNIEGSEYPVLKECESCLRHVKNTTIEYHGFPEIGDKLHLILELLHRNGFRYLIHDFDALTNSATKPPFKTSQTLRYYLLISAINTSMLN